ncbi:MAG: signal peptidase II [bacterium]
MKNLHKLFLILLLLTLSIGCDQITKDIAQKNLKSSLPRTYLNDTVRLHYAENPGSMLGFGARLPQRMRFWFLTVLPACFLVGLFGYLLLSRKLTQAQFYAFSLILGGGVSNLLDRFLNDGVVIDFMNIGIGQVRTGIFNVADVLIMAGLGLLLLFNVRLRQGKESSEIASAEDFESSGN